MTRRMLNEWINLTQSCISNFRFSVSKMEVQGGESLHQEVFFLMGNLEYIHEETHIKELHQEVLGKGSTFPSFFFFLNLLNILSKAVKGLL